MSSKNDLIVRNIFYMSENLGIRIKNCRENIRLSQDGLAKIFDVSRTTVTNWESGTNLPDVKKLAVMAELFKVSLDWLARGEESNYKPPISNLTELTGNAKIVSAKFFPKIDRVTAGNYSNNVYEENIIDMVYIDYPKNNCFVVEVEGDSMQCDDPDKSINPGDNLLIDPSETPMQGDLIIIKTSEQRQMVKQYFYRNDLIELHSYNPKHPIIYIDPNQLEYMFRVVYHQPKGRKK